MRLPMKNLNLRSNAIDTIVFDFDGTLADTLAASLITFKTTLQHFNINVPIPIDIKTYGPLSVAGMFRTAGITEENCLSESSTFSVLPAAPMRSGDRSPGRIWVRKYCSRQVPLPQIHSWSAIRSATLRWRSKPA